MTQNKKRLIILDLDHTLIYSAGQKLPGVKELLEYLPNLIIHQRPLTSELVKICQNMGEVVVFTTAVKGYAESVCNKLNINYLQLFSRVDCRINNGMFEKYVEQQWLEKFDDIIIIDDSPEVWDSNAHKNCTFLVPEKFMGHPNDNGLKTVIGILTEIKDGY